MQAAHLASKDVGEAVPVIDDALQNDEEVALVVGECLGVLGWADDGDRVLSMARTHGEAHAVEASDHLMWLMRQMRQSARTSWMTKLTSQMASLAVILPILNRLAK
ncbi:hypothetical protein Y1Q_0022529 [Alligator mississippiensis]|uniref:Uncharacterized protein n=1 Tax=Alligator mississippiensis TaxID=8496 RepID=A0A151NWE8_ALLMI|nr:hypothetical protein Y1Q_0022529 [Alligator mississippiensis]